MGAGLKLPLLYSVSSANDIQDCINFVGKKGSQETFSHSIPKPLPWLSDLPFFIYMSISLPVLQAQLNFPATLISNATISQQTSSHEIPLRGKIIQEYGRVGTSATKDAVLFSSQKLQGFPQDALNSRWHISLLKKKKEPGSCFWLEPHLSAA